MRRCLFAATILLIAVSVTFAEEVGNLSANPYHPDSTSNPYGAGSPYRSNSINNPYGRYGSHFSPYSTISPYTTHAHRLYDSEGNYRGKLSSDPYDPDSISNPYGRYGNKYSPESINNPFGAGNRFAPDSPCSPYGSGGQIEGEESLAYGGLIHGACGA